MTSIRPLGEVGVCGGHFASQLRIAARLVNSVAKHRAQAASAGWDDQQGVAKVSDLDGPTLADVPAAPGLGRKCHLTPGRYSELSDTHIEIVLLTRHRYRAALYDLLTCPATDRSVPLF